MDKNINIDHKLIEYIFSHTNNLHPVQKELLKYNESLGHVKRLQMSILQANFLQFLIKSINHNEKWQKKLPPLIISFGLKAYKTSANFILVEVKDQNKKKLRISEHLKKKIIIRNLDN